MDAGSGGLLLTGSGNIPLCGYTAWQLYGIASIRRRSSVTTHEYHVALQSRGTLALPAELRKRHHLDGPGAQVRIVERADGVIELHPMVAVPADQRWFWTERWQRMEREADEDVAAGRIRRHESVDDLLSALDK